MYFLICKAQSYKVPPGGYKEVMGKCVLQFYQKISNLISHCFSHLHLRVIRLSLFKIYSHCPGDSDLPLDDMVLSDSSFSLFLYFPDLIMLYHRCQQLSIVSANNFVNFLCPGYSCSLFFVILSHILFPIFAPAMPQMNPAIIPAMTSVG